MRRLLILGCLVWTSCTGDNAEQPRIDAGPEAPSVDVAPLDGASGGYALSFDGVRSYATAGNGGFAPVGSSFTIELWVNFASAAGNQDFIALRTDLASGVQIGFHAGVLAAWRVYVDRVLIQAPTNPSSEVWHHVAYTFGNTTHTLYVDGAVVATSTSVTDGHTPTSAWLGTLDGSASLFKGQMDEVMVWTVARPASGILSDMQRRTSGHEAGLVAYWAFDDAGSGGRSADLSGHGNDVTLGDGVAAYMPSRVPSALPATP